MIASPRNLTRQIIAASALGIVFGLAVHALIGDPTRAENLVAALDFVTSLFLRAIKMLIAPLVLAALVSGIGRTEGLESVGRMAGRAMLWFIGAGLLAALAALAVAALLAPGAGLHLHATAAGSGVRPPPFDIAGFLRNIIPTSIADAMARNDVLPILFFAILAGFALARMGEAGAGLLRLADGLLGMMLTMAGLVMRFAPLAVFCAIAAALAKDGAGVIVTYAGFVGGFYLALGLLWLAMIGAGALALGRHALRDLLGALRQPALIALATTSAEAAYPALLQKLEGYGVPNRVAGFVLPLGYAFNLIGSMCYCTFAVLFIAHAYDVLLSPAQIAQLLFMLFVTSKGIANMPRASIVVVAATAPHFGLPEAGIAFILGIDHVLDMGRTATNVVANGIVAAIVARSEQPAIAPEGEF
ncbi:dicarboxylate/amino acid:cation symporter [Sphingomonas quercus]|uniref:Dicarboxylate/amino acid:cation symporter n=1 Tax=Sphingomonas quercus TaxID=2842451 RepID=A0ABS6BID5_9SPHN|nr:dicarboxylate/amino acid:cation symporter [Sphingomonas quercus]